MLWLMLLPLLYNLVADVVPTIDVPLIRFLLKALLCQLQMLLPLTGLIVADVIARWLMLCHFRYIIGGQCNYHPGCGWQVL